MAQVTTRDNGLTPRCFLTADNASVSVAVAGLTTILEVQVQSLSRLFVEILPVTNALDAFQVQVRANQSGNYITILSAAADFTAPAGVLAGASGDLTTLAAAATGWLLMDVFGFESVRLQASANTGVSTVTVHAGAA